MEKLFNWISLVFGVIGGFIANIIGGIDGIMIALISLVILDYITGVIKAIANKELSSEIGFRGIAKKIMTFVIVAVACILQSYISADVPLREMVIMFYIANEGISLLENTAEFVPIPKALKDILIQIRNKGDNNNE